MSVQQIFFVTDPNDVLVAQIFLTETHTPLLTLLCLCYDQAIIIGCDLPSGPNAAFVAFPYRKVNPSQNLYIN